MRLFCQLREDLTRRMRETIIPQIRSRDAAANSVRRAMHHGRRGYYISVDGMNRRRLDICRGRVNRRTARNEGHLPPPGHLLPPKATGYAVTVRVLGSGRSEVTESMVTIRSPLCA